MGSRIGGEFEISVRDLMSETNQWSEDQLSIYTDTGRSAIYLALQAILERGGKKIAWLPRYICPSVYMPFIQLGFKINFYCMNEYLQYPSQLPTKMQNETFLYVHYYGKKNKKIVHWLNTCQIKKDNFIIEDCVQASLNENVGADGDFSIRSFRKFLPQPDGAVLTYKNSFCYHLEESNEQFISQRFLGKVLREVDKEEKEFLDFLTASELMLNGRIIPRKYSWISKILYSKSNLAYVKQKRIENWRYLQSLLIQSNLEKKYIESLYNDIEFGEIPLGYPIIVKNNKRDDLRERLKKRQIFCPIHWNLGNYNDKRFALENQLSESILTLPIDQRVNFVMLEYMVSEIKKILKSDGNEK